MPEWPILLPMTQPTLYQVQQNAPPTLCPWIHHEAPQTFVKMIGYLLVPIDFVTFATNSPQQLFPKFPMRYRIFGMTFRLIQHWGYLYTQSWRWIHSWPISFKKKISNCKWVSNTTKHCRLASVIDAWLPKFTQRTSFCLSPCNHPSQDHTSSIQLSWPNPMENNAFQ